MSKEGVSTLDCVVKRSQWGTFRMLYVFIISHRAMKMMNLRIKTPQKKKGEDDNKDDKDKIVVLVMCMIALEMEEEIIRRRNLKI